MPNDGTIAVCYSKSLTMPSLPPDLQLHNNHNLEAGKAQKHYIQQSATYSSTYSQWVKHGCFFHWKFKGGRGEREAWGTRRLLPTWQSDLKHQSHWERMVRNKDEKERGGKNDSDTGRDSNPRLGIYGLSCSNQLSYRVTRQLNWIFRLTSGRHSVSLVTSQIYLRIVCLVTLGSILGLFYLQRSYLNESYCSMSNYWGGPLAP